MWMNREEAMQIFKKYDRDMYEYYMKNAWYLGSGALMYAEKLKREHEHECH